MDRSFLQVIKSFLFPAVCCLVAVGAVNGQASSPKPLQLPNGWSLTPAGRSIPLSSDLPLNMAVSPDHRYLAVTDNGYDRQGIDLIDLQKEKLVDQVEIGKSWLGLCFEKKRPYLYISGGNDNIIVRYVLNQDRLIVRDTMRLGRPWPEEKIGVAGIAIDERRQLIYAVTKENGSLYIGDLRTMRTIRHVQLSAPAYTCLLNPAGTELYISGWGGSKVWIYSPDKKRLIDSVATGDHPNDLAITHNGKWLYVANANTNSVSVIDVRERKEVETLNAALYPDAPIGSTTNSVALSADGHTLYVANADNNCLAVFDVTRPGNSRSKGFIPTGWYPTAVKAIAGKILVLNGKGMSSFANPDTAYVGGLFHGALSIIPSTSEALLGRYSRRVYLNTPYSKEKESLAAGQPGNPIPMKKGDPTPIRYVFYVLRENKTYDEILGDLPQGNGDPGLCLFGDSVTPNGHAIASQYVLLDNFYVDAEVSVDGHCWSMAGYATDYVEKSWPSDYSNRGGTDDFESAGPIANATNGFIWDACLRGNVSFRDYGEMRDNILHPIPTLTDPSHFCAGFPAWNLGITDVYREQQFEHDLDSLVAIHAVRSLNTIYLPNDHTNGLAKDSLTPTSYIADNDLALGKLVDHISHSAIWKESAIFVLEDDAQGGADHVDAHRSVAYVISPFVKAHSVNHTPYTTSSVLRTMELILGLPPMSQYDAGATPMWNCFGPGLQSETFTARAARVDLLRRNKGASLSALRSARFDFSHPDRAPDKLFSEVIWKSVKGEESEMPGPRRGAFLKAHEKDPD
jgi:YVTN family beta-propeller protein